MSNSHITTSGDVKLIHHALTANMLMNLISPKTRLNGLHLSQTVHAYLHCSPRGELQKLTEVAKNAEKDVVWVKVNSRSSNLAPFERDKTRQRGVTDAGTTVPLSPHLQCRYSDDNTRAHHG